MVNRYFLLLSALLISSCASLPKTSRSFVEAVEISKNRQFDQARPMLIKDCTDGVAAACSLMGKDSQISQHLPILQGLSPFSTANFRILTTKTEGYLYFVYPKHLVGTDQVLNQGRWVSPLFKEERKFSDWTLVGLKVNGLENGLAYNLDIYSTKGELIDRRTFQTLNLGKPNLNFIVASCLDDTFNKEQEKMWSEVYDNQPDVIFMIGDNVDKKTTPLNMAAPNELLWTRYVDARKELKIFQSEKLIPVVALWDDQDSDTQVDGTYLGEAKSVFEAFYAQDEVPEVFIKGPGVSSYFQAAGQNFFFMDGRSSKATEAQVDQNQTHWGKATEDWMFELLNKNKAPTWIVSGDQIFSGNQQTLATEGKPTVNITELKNKWKTLSIPLVFLSGDKQLTEINRIEKDQLGYPTYELTSSGIHTKATTEIVEKSSNPNKLVGVAGQMNYMFINSTAFRGSLRFSVKALGLNKSILYQRDLSVRR